MGVARLYTDGQIEACTIKNEAELNARVRGVAGVIKRHAEPACLGVCIEEPFSGQFSSVKALLPMLGAAVLQCEESGLPYSIINLMKLKAHATGKGNAKKPEMQAAARARWGKDLSEDEADAAWAAAYAMDCDLFA